MIQRIQTVYLLVAAILLTICACLPVGVFKPEGMGADQEMYNLCIISETDGWNFTVCGLFVMLAATVATSVTTIFGYNNRKRQIRNCMVAIELLLIWVALYVVFGFVVGQDKMEFRCEYVAVLPLVSIVLIWLARRGIIADENLVKAADRIR